MTSNFSKILNSFIIADRELLFKKQKEKSRSQGAGVLAFEHLSFSNFGASLWCHRR
jgi:hypothetical protein